MMTRRIISAILLCFMTQVAFLGGVITEELFAWGERIFESAPLSDPAPGRDESSDRKPAETVSDPNAHCSQETADDAPCYDSRRDRFVMGVDYKTKCDAC